MEAAISPRLLLAEHRWPSGAQEGGRADEEQQYDEEGVEVEQRRLPSGRGRPQHHDGRGVVVLVLTMPARAARARQEKRTQTFLGGLHVLLSMWWWVGRRFYISNVCLPPPSNIYLPTRRVGRRVVSWTLVAGAGCSRKCFPLPWNLTQRKERARTLRCYGCSAMLVAATGGCGHDG